MWASRPEVVILVITLSICPVILMSPLQRGYISVYGCCILILPVPVWYQHMFRRSLVFENLKKHDLFQTSFESSCPWEVVVSHFRYPEKTWREVRDRIWIPLWAGSLQVWSDSLWFTVLCLIVFKFPLKSLWGTLPVQCGLLEACGPCSEFKVAYWGLGFPKVHFY